MTQPICVNQYKMIKGLSNLVTCDYDTLTNEELENKVKQMEIWFDKNYLAYEYDDEKRRKRHIFEVCYFYALYLLKRLPDNYAHTLSTKYLKGWIKPDDVVSSLS